MARSRKKHIGGKNPAGGMARFFSPSNLDRYRKLASGKIDKAEQHRLLEDLAGEMRAFKREALAAGSHHAAEGSIVSQSHDGI
jgi:hypothetical protein